MLGLAWRPEWHVHRCLPEQLQAPHLLPSRAGSLLGAPPWPMLAVPACPRAPAPPTPFPRLSLAPAAHLQRARFHHRSLPMCWIELMLWAGGGGCGWGLRGCLCVSATRFCICPKAVPPLRFVGSLSTSSEPCLGACDVAGFGECRLHPWAQMPVSRYQQQQMMFIWGKTWSQYLMMRERWRARAKRWPEKPLTNSTVRCGSIRESPPGSPGAGGVVLSGAGGETSRWPAGAVMGWAGVRRQS